MDDSAKVDMFKELGSKLDICKKCSIIGNTTSDCRFNIICKICQKEHAANIPILTFNITQRACHINNVI